MTDKPATPTLMGWCRDRHHALCRREYVGQFGIRWRCSCRCHDERGDE